MRLGVLPLVNEQKMSFYLSVHYEGFLEFLSCDTADTPFLKSNGAFTLVLHGQTDFNGQTGSHLNLIITPAN